MVVKSNGAVYFSDTINGIRGGATGPSRELPFNGFYLVKDGNITYLGGDRDPGKGAPNGITLSPDEKYLYVSSAARVEGTTRLPATVWRYEIRPDDTVTNGRVFIPDSGSDGMKVDRRGNLYTTAGGGATPVVRITSPEGKPARQARAAVQDEGTASRGFAPPMWLLVTRTTGVFTSPHALTSIGCV